MPRRPWFTKGIVTRWLWTRVEYGEKMKDVVQRLLVIVRRRGVKMRFLLLDKGFSVSR